MAEIDSVTGKHLFQSAYSWLEKNSPDGIGRQISNYLKPSHAQQPQSLNDLYEKLLESLTQASSKPRVLACALPNKSISDLAQVTFGFDPVKTREHYNRDSMRLLKTIEETYKPQKTIRAETLSIWPKYCKTMLSSAAFVCQFESSQQFMSWARDLAANPTTRTALPLIVENEIEGCGFALACNFLIHIGFEQYAKPDTHVKYILARLDLMSNADSDYETLKILQNLSTHATQSPYSLDKLLYLIGSGNYFLHKGHSPVSKRSERRDAFISYVRGAGLN